MKAIRSILLSVFVTMSVNTIAKVNFTPPFTRSIHNGNKQTIFSNIYIEGEYNKLSGMVEVTFKQDIDDLWLVYQVTYVCLAAC